MQTTFFGNYRRVNFLTQKVGELGLVHFQVASQEQYHIFVFIIGLVHHGLGTVLRVSVQIGAYLLNGVHTRGVHLSQRLRGGIFHRLQDRLGSLHVGFISAVVAQHDRVLTNGGQEHKFVGYAAAHHTGV